MTLPIIDPDQPFQSEYAPFLREAVACLKSGFGKYLHSVYVYGSVARKNAMPNQSNVDLVIVTKRGFDSQRSQVFNTIKWRAKQAYPHVKGISFKSAEVSEVASLNSIFTWGFLLRHCCVCIHGEDLADCFGDYQPSWEIAKHWNMDVEEWLQTYRQKIARAQQVETMLDAQRVICKKLLRASYSLVMHNDKQWIEDPYLCGEAFLRYYPEKAQEIERLGILFSGRVIPKRSVIGLVDGFGSWLVKQYDKTEFKIG